MDKRLYEGGLVTIPLIKNNNFKPCPNYLIFDYQQGKTSALSPNLQTSEMENKDCVFSSYRLVNREILPQYENRPEEFIERTLLPSEQINIPIELLSCLFTHERILQNINIINQVLSFFLFRGELQGLILQVDENVLNQIIETKNQVFEIQ